ncbi:MAG: hypothetical protein QF645_10755, partial [Planctomycetota bacterium]|nr:hypothetical protein [Planctomycetota bacterium]
FKALQQEKVTNCANNLSQLWKIQNQYRVEYGGPNKFFPEETGEQFWLRLSDREIRLIDNSSPKLFECPVEGSTNRGNTDFRGPSSNVNKYTGGGEPVGADKIYNHSDDGSEGGNVLRKSGDVQTGGTG